MSLIEFEASRTAPAAASSARGRGAVRTDANGQPLPQAKLWLNVGYMKNERFVNLPLGLPIDTMEPAEVRGSNQDWLKFSKARNDLLEGLKGLIEKLAPGDEMELPNLIIKIRRTQGEVAIEGENDFEVDLGNILGGGTVVNPANERAQAAAE